MDTSALVKLVIEEAESEALEHWLTLQNDVVTTSVIGKVELIRACRRAKPESVPHATLLMADLPLMPLTGAVSTIAENISPPLVRSLDALHLATAFQLGDLLDSFVTYDKRQRDAAVLAELPVKSPGMA